MEILIGAAVGILVAFFGYVSWRHGYKCGEAKKEDKPLPPMVEKNIEARQAKEREENAKKVNPLSALMGWDGDSK